MKTNTVLAIAVAAALAGCSEGSDPAAEPAETTEAAPAAVADDNDAPEPVVAETQEHGHEHEGDEAPHSH